MDDARTVEGEGRAAIDYKVAIVASESLGRVKRDSAKTLVDRVGKVDLLPLPRAEEESLVLADGAAEFETVLVQLDDGFFEALGAGERFV